MAETAQEPQRRGLLGRLDEDESGAAMVEFVVVFPVQLALTLAILQFALIANAHIVTAHAAFAAARAAAVADGYANRTLPAAVARQAAATRAAARIVGTLTTGDPTVPQGTPPPTLNGSLQWPGGGGLWGYGALQQGETYGGLRVRAINYRTDGYVAAHVRFNYPLTIPVARRFFATTVQPGYIQRLGDGNGPDTPLFEIERVGFVATPWLKAR